MKRKFTLLLAMIATISLLVRKSQMPFLGQQITSLPAKTKV